MELESVLVEVGHASTKNGCARGAFDQRFPCVSAERCSSQENSAAGKNFQDI
jgi:hypothetical protein